MDPTAQFIQLGAGYVIAAVEGLAIVFLFKKLSDKDAVIANRDEVISILQEKRVSDAERRGEYVQNVANQLTGPIGKILASQETFARFIENYTWKKK